MTQSFIFLGYSASHHSYVCYSLTKKKFISRHVILNEEEFPSNLISPPCRARQLCTLPSSTPLLLSKSLLSLHPLLFLHPLPPSSFSLSQPLGPYRPHSYSPSHPIPSPPPTLPQSSTLKPHLVYHHCRPPTSPSGPLFPPPFLILILLPPAPPLLMLLPLFQSYLPLLPLLRYLLSLLYLLFLRFPPQPLPSPFSNSPATVPLSSPSLPHSSQPFSTPSPPNANPSISHSTTFPPSSSSHQLSLLSSPFSNTLLSFLFLLPIISFLSCPHSPGVKPYMLNSLPNQTKRMVFKIKTIADGSIDRHKARLVAKGYCRRMFT